MGPIRAGVPLQDMSGPVRRRNVIRRSVEQQPIGAVEALSGLLQRHRFPDQPILERAVAMISDCIPRQILGCTARSVQE